MRLLFPDSTGAGGNPLPAPNSSGDAPPAPAPPPAATVVLDSTAVEGDAAEIVRLRRENEDTGRKLKERETRISELEDQNFQLKKIPPPPNKKDWSEGNTFFG